MVDKPHFKASAASVAAVSTIVERTTRDSFENFQASLGIGTSNLNSFATYGFNPITRNRQLLEWAYRGSWIVRAAIKTIADDMTREGITMTSDISPDDIDQIERSWDQLKIWQGINENICWARLYGGSVAVILIDGQRLDTPLRIETVGKGQFKGLCVLDRWMIQPPMSDLITDYGPDLGKPRTYQIIGDSLKLPRQTVHHSRIIRMEGDDLPYYQRLAENGWALSVLEPIYDRLIEFDSASTGTAQLMHKAHLRTLKVKDLRQIIALGGPAYASLLTQMKNIRVFQSNEGLTLLDASDEFEVHPYSFTGLAEVIQQFSSQLSGSLGIPVTRLFGVSPGGLNSTGQNDLVTYYDKIKQLQEDNLRSDILWLLRIMHMSTLGRPANTDLNFKFRSLWQMDESMKADVANKNATTIVSTFSAGVIPRDVALTELKQQSDATGMFSNITDEQIEEAKNDPPPVASAISAVPGAPKPALGGEQAAPPSAQAGAAAGGAGAGNVTSLEALRGLHGPFPTGAATPKPVGQVDDPHGLTKLLQVG